MPMRKFEFCVTVCVTCLTCVICMFIVSPWIMRQAEREELPIVVRLNDRSLDTGKKTTVLRYNGVGFERLRDFCTWTAEFDCFKMKTPAGRVPIYLHDPGKDHFISDIFLRKDKQDPELLVIIALMKSMDNPMLVDIGANIASFAIAITKTLNVNALLVEPIVENAVRTCKTIQDNNVTDKMTLIYNAVSSKHENVGLFKFTNNFGSSQVIKFEDKHTGGPLSCTKPRSIMAVTLDDLIPYVTSRKVFLKVDVEGHENHVILGGLKFLDTLDVPFIHMEWGLMRNKPEPAQQIMKLLRARNYVAYNPMPSIKGPHLDFNKFKGWGGNVIWVKKP